MNYLLSTLATLATIFFLIILVFPATWLLTTTTLPIAATVITWVSGWTLTGKLIASIVTLGCFVSIQN